MDCKKLDEVTGDVVAGTLDAVQSAEAAGHLAGCARCAGEVERYRQAIRLIEAVRDPVMPEGFWDRQRLAVMHAIRRTMAVRSWEAPPMYLIALLTVLAGYLVVSLDVAGQALVEFAQAVAAGGGISATSLSLVPLYAGLLALALFSFSERGHQAAARAGRGRP
jgi:hypothetical protein